MGNPILSKKSETIFEDKFDKLSMKDIAIELKHYRIGTAPENPSFVANQEEAKHKIIEKFKDFFDLSTGLELPILISNIGDGKTHFIRMISDAFSKVNNVRVRRIYIRDEQVDIKLKILEAVERNEIKNCVNKIFKKYKVASNDENYAVANLQEKYGINKNLAITLIKGNLNDVKIHTQAIQLLKGNFEVEFIDTYLYNFQESSEEFYFDFLKILCDYFEAENLYTIIVFDEIEHVMDWKDQEKQKRFFRNIKELTDKLTLYKNLFLILAATQIYGGEDFVQHINLIEPATYDRMKSLFINLKDISSDEEVMNLINYLKKRYEKYYSINLDENLVFTHLKQRFKTERVENTYRNYAQEITKIFDEYRNNEHCNEEISDKKEKNAFNNIDVDTYDAKKQALIRWKNAASPIANKSFIVEAVGALLVLSGNELININRRTGYIIVSSKEKEKKLFYITYTSRKNFAKLFSDKLNVALRIKEQKSIKSLVYLYPKELTKLDKNQIDSYRNQGIEIVSYDDQLIIKLLILLDEKVSVDYKKQIANDIKKSGDFVI
ncbi:hypothetical protein [Clostridium akagii]|uniref:hypothetical protein n=1 Tax=Clostridium akagii TaxID=91623 RepID=UPI0004787146|nr:hypothetical protein [Clostridium akagii]